MRLSWDEISRRAKAFSEEWKDAHYEKGETQSFYNDFFKIFGIKRRQVAIFEKQVQSIEQNRRGFIDLFWPGTLIVEQKSAGKDLLAAQMQAAEYFNWLSERDQPRFILTCDFQRWKLIDLDNNGAELNFLLKDLHKHVSAFDFMLGRRVTFETQATVTIKAAELMGKLHDALEESGYVGHELEQFLVRTLFCLFADDTGIFQPKDIFRQFLENDTKEDGSDTGSQISELFDILDTPDGSNGTADLRLAGTSDELKAFPYINGSLFKGRLRIPKFDKKMRGHLIDACRHDWSGVSPAIFGSLFQSVMDGAERRAQGAHYTTEANIMKVIGPLFLDDLKAELEAIESRKTGRDGLLQTFLHKLATLRFFDPACGCGNFLVIAYREIRALELRALKLRYPDGGMNAALMSRVTVDQFYGIEIGEFPAKIAEVAMWMADHLANNWMNEAFNTNYARIPLKGGATILHGDALETDWSSLLTPDKCSYIMGNPPFIGAKFQTDEQRAQVRRIAGLGGSGGTLDYVAAWFIKAGQFVQANSRIRVGFVSTNSITQGEQVAQLWPILFDRFGLEIAFAHRTFAWGSEARGKAHVHVVIIGLAHRDNEPKEKRLFSYPDIRRDPVESRHGALTAYLFDAKTASNRHLVVRSSSRPLSDQGELGYGSQPIDGGHLIFDAERRALFIERNPGLKRYLRPFIGSQEYINGGERWILALQEASPGERRTPDCKSILESVSKFRTASKRPVTRELAEYPAEFAFTTIPTADFLVVPEVSSERRKYVPIGWLSPPTIPSNLVRAKEQASLYDFAILTSAIHVAWLSHIGGRLKSDYRYSNSLVYNTFPWPDATAAQRLKIEELAQAVLDARAAWPTSSLADLYDPDTMPANLRRAHAALDAAVDRLYRARPFDSDRDRVEHLFGLYEKMVDPLSGAEAQNKRVIRKGKKKADPGSSPG